MIEVYAIADSVFSPLGTTTVQVMASLRANRTGISSQTWPDDKSTSFLAAAINPEVIDQSFGNAGGNPKLYTKLEKMLIVSVSDVLQTSGINASAPDTLFLFSTTKGNIDLLKKTPTGLIPENRVYLHSMASAVCRYFNNTNQFIVVSSACISGVLAIITAKKILQAGKYKHVIVVGGDIVSFFTLSGFQSFQAISPVACKPFDVSRQGISLGEGSGAILLSSDRSLTQGKHQIRIGYGATSNDANHISGPSRSGDGLLLAIRKVMEQSKLLPADIGYISAHGTGTLYNDEMEAKAIASAGLERIPVNSLKGYFGHTLGAAGIIESIITMQSMKGNELFQSLGYQNHGVSTKLKIITKNKTAVVDHALKLASGFGGCNAALIFSGEEANISTSTA